MAGLGKHEKLRKECFQVPKPNKLHTIRKNYPLWKKRIDEVNSGKAILVLYEWAGLPYRSKTRELFRFDRDSEIGVQKLSFFGFNLNFPRAIKPGESSTNEVLALIPSNLAHNDGLSLQDFKDWFKDYDLSEPLAIIHFTKNYRY
jgi:hypothetical protein